MRRAARQLAALAAAGLYACQPSVQIGSDCDRQDCGLGLAGMNGEDSQLPGERTPSGAIDQLDLLLVIDNSTTMMEEQAAFADALPILIERLVSGDTDRTAKAEDEPEFRPVKDIHVGVVSTDLGLEGISDIDRCFGAGDDGQLMPCGAGDTGAFSSFGEKGTVSALAMDAVCRSQIGTQGCSFEQPLEAAFRALAPAPEGHRDDLNQGFLRPESLLVVVLLTDEEDCSLQDTRIITPAPYLDPADPLTAQGLNTRCSQNPDALFPIGRYVEGLRKLRPGADDRVMFFAIAGVPVEMVNAAALAQVKLEDPARREQFYTSILNAPGMRESVDDQGTPTPDDDAIAPVCDSEFGTAAPAPRLVQVARGFGMNGLVQSICERDLSRPINAILRSIGRRLGAKGI
jgi:hypothetical protein